MKRPRQATQRKLPRIVLAGARQAMRNGKTLGSVLDLSTAGVFIVCTSKLLVGQELWVQFEVPDPESPSRRVKVQVLGEIRHARRGEHRGLGIRFLRMESADARAIEAAVAAAQSSQPEDEVAATGAASPSESL
ncbi:MAG: PilZ domain-containing protein [Pseudomonadota bacterium]